MKLMPFTTTVHKQLLDQGYTYLVKKHAATANSFNEAPEIITLEAVKFKPQSRQGICLETGDVQNLLNSKSEQYYVLVNQNVAAEM
jgi:hypothetical protein